MSADLLGKTITFGLNPEGVEDQALIVTNVRQEFPPDGFPTTTIEGVVVNAQDVDTDMYPMATTKELPTPPRTGRRQLDMD
jgi:hypothetical protein